MDMSFPKKFTENQNLIKFLLVVLNVASIEKISIFLNKSSLNFVAKIMDQVKNNAKMRSSKK